MENKKKEKKIKTLKVEFLLFCGTQTKVCIRDNAGIQNDIKSFFV